MEYIDINGGYGTASNSLEQEEKDKAIGETIENMEKYFKMKNQFVDYETAELLKSLEFNEPCITGYLDGNNLEEIDSALIRNKGMAENWTTAPLWQQAEQWLWDKNRIHVKVFGFESQKFNCYFYQNDGFISATKYVSSPIEARQEGIKDAIHYLFNKLHK